MPQTISEDILKNMAVFLAMQMMGSTMSDKNVVLLSQITFL